MRTDLLPREGAPTLLLLLGMLYTAFYAVQVADWGERIWMAPIMAVAGAMVGLIAAKSRLRAIWALVLAAVIGVELQLIAHAVMSPGTVWSEKLAWLSTRLYGWIAVASSHGAEHDQVVFASIVSATAFVLGFASSWLVFRLQSAWGALVINAAAGVVHLSYATVDSIPPFLTSLVIGILMVSSLELHLRQVAWGVIGAPVQAVSVLWTLTAAGGLAFSALLVSMQLPSGQLHQELAVRYAEFTEPWQDFQRQIDTLVGGGRGQARPSAGLSFSRSLVPRENFDLGQQPLLQIASPQRRYWRATTYDQYDGGSISSSSSAEQRYGPEAELPNDPDGGTRRLLVELTVTVVGPPSQSIFVADAPRLLSLAATVEERDVAWDLGAIQAVVPLQQGQSYRLTAAVPQVSLRELSEASSLYPSWTDRYRELPVALPARVGELTNELTLGARTPLEKALAIETYLRALAYSTHTVAPPPERDWVDFLLFDSRQGYCDYFATAMTVMLRTQGIPARVASGFAPGTFDSRERVWNVNESDAHSWTEVYFPGYGWYTFEPSAARSVPERFEVLPAPTLQGGADRQDGLGDDGFLDDLPTSGSGENVPGSVSPTPSGLLLLALSAALLLTGTGLLSLSTFWERGLGREVPARRRYAQLGRVLGLGGWRPPPSSTPFELATELEHRQPGLRPYLRRLVERYVAATYGRPLPDESDAQVEVAWRRLRLPLFQIFLKSRIRRSQGQFPAATLPGDELSSDTPGRPSGA